MPVDVYIDSATETFIFELALHAERVLDERWNGWLRPLATVEAFASFLDRWRRNDPNGIWGYVTEVGEAPDTVLVYLNSDSDEPEAFAYAGQAASGEALYDLTGWLWTVESSDP